MYTKLKIKVTKEILERSKLCGHTQWDTGANCAIALAIRDIFPQAYIASDFIMPLYYSNKFLQSCSNVADMDNHPHTIQLPSKAKHFINSFDDLMPDERMEMPELEFEINIPDAVIEQIDISSIQRLLANHPNLQLV